MTMPLQSLTLLLIILLSIFTSALPPTQQALQSDNNNIIIIRNATLNDTSSITDIILDAFGPAPYNQYIYQFATQHAKYHRHCLERQVSHLLKRQADSDIVHVIDAPIPNSTERKAVSIAIWELGSQRTRGIPQFPFFTLPRAHVEACSEHLDLNVTRAIHWSREFVTYKHRYIDLPYGDQVYLGLLATHPQFDGHGFGAAQVEWGKRLAKDRGRGENVTLIASPPGYALYSTIEFQSIANLSYTKVGGAFLTWQEVMVYTP